MTSHIPKQSPWVRCPALELLCSSLCDPPNKNVGRPLHYVIEVGISTGESCTAIVWCLTDHLSNPIFLQLAGSTCYETMLFNRAKSGVAAWNGSFDKNQAEKLMVYWNIFKGNFFPLKMGKMEGILNNLSLATYNCRGFKSSLPDVQKLLHDYQIIFLQETWLAKQQLDNLSCLGVSHFAFGRADYDFDDDLVHGRGHGGTAIYWSKNLKASSFSNCDGSIIGLRVCLKKSELCLINVYLPYCSRANTDEFLACLGKLSQLFEELQCPNICFEGDFNAGATNTFGGLLEDFVWKMILSFLIMHYYPRTHSHTLVMHTTHLLG